ncbi:MAG: hypothetical protein NW226_10475 [Microscillaceae bacterium]|nr:hypothetical protein [Microscillaceae bacterium]
MIKKTALVGIALLAILTNLPLLAQMNKAYDLAGKMVRSKLEQEDAQNIKILDNLNEADIIVVSGTYDHIHQVLESMHIPYLSISQEQVLQAELKPFHTVFVNCASSFPAEAAHKLAAFVQSGGQLITTDWALKNVLEVAFPHTVAYNNKPTQDEVVKITVHDTTDHAVASFVEEKTDPVWWLEGSSYPIQILDKERVKVLVKSQELKDKYGEEAVIVRFEYGKGRVYHMISHFYLQRTEAKVAKQALEAEEYLKEMNASEDVLKDAEKNQVTYGEMQSANRSADFVTRVIIHQAKKK